MRSQIPCVSGARPGFGTALQTFFGAISAMNRSEDFKNSRAWPVSGLAVIAMAPPGSIREVGNALIMRGDIPEFHTHHLPAYSVAFHLKGAAKVEWKRGAKYREFTSKPGTFSVVSGDGLNAFRCVGMVETLNRAITPDQLARIAEREGLPAPDSLVLTETHEDFSREINLLGQSFASLLLSPHTTSVLYAETLWTQITLQLLWKYSSLPNQGEAPYERLSDARIRRVIDYLQDALGQEIRLTELAGMVDLSPSHFLTAFKKGTGKTPYRYLTELRMSRACELLRNPHNSILGVALAVGFSSQSHFTSTFTRFMKVTPSSYRTEVLGLRSDDPG